MYSGMLCHYGNRLFVYGPDRLSLKAATQEPFDTVHTFATGDLLHLHTYSPFTVITLQ